MPQKQFSRRDFICAAGCVAAAAALAQPSSLLAAKPAKRWVVGCRDEMLRTANTADSWSAMKALGAEAIEVQVLPDMTCPGLVHPEARYELGTDDGLKRLKNDLAKNGCRISAFMMANSLETRYDQEMEWTGRVVKAAVALQVPAIRIDVVPSKMSKEEFQPYAIKACKQMCDIAKDQPVRFGVENHGKVTNDPDFLDRLFDGVGSSQLGLTMDFANFYWWGHPLADLYKIYERFAPRAVHTHCKSIGYPKEKQNIKREMGWEYAKYNCPIHQGDIDFRRVVGILRRAGYSGDLCVEDESLGKAPKGTEADLVRKQIAMLKELSGAA